METFSQKMIDNAKAGKCPVCGKQKKDHSKKMLRNCKRVFAKRFSSRTQTLTLPSGQKIEVNPYSDVHIRRAKRWLKKWLSDEKWKSSLKTEVAKSKILQLKRCSNKSNGSATSNEILHQIQSRNVLQNYPWWKNALLGLWKMIESTKCNVKGCSKTVTYQGFCAKHHYFTDGEKWLSFLASINAKSVKLSLTLCLKYYITKK